MKFQLCASTQNSTIWVQVCKSVRLPVRGTTVAISPRMSSPPSRDHSHARLGRGTGSGLVGVEDVWVSAPSGIRGPPRRQAEVKLPSHAYNGLPSRPLG